MRKRKWWLLLPVLAFAGLMAALLCPRVLGA